jgi:LacI family transcriptional regulator
MNPVFPPIVRGADEVLRERGYWTLVVNTDDDQDRERSQIGNLRSRLVDGLIVATAKLEHALLTELAQQGVPVVQVNRRTEGANISAVTPDDAAGIRLAVNHLVELGHRKILHLAGPQDTSAGLLRAQSFKSAASNRGLSAQEAPVFVCDRWSMQAGKRALGEALDVVRSVTAIVAGNDLIALGSIELLNERGIACPRDVSIVGFNNMPFLDRMNPPLTTISIPHHDIGTEGARMLLEAIEGGSRPPRWVQLPLTLVTRGSTARPPS